MRSIRITQWQDGDFFIGYLNDYPEYETQGTSNAELLENLKDLLIDIESNSIPYIRHTEELMVV